MIFVIMSPFIFPKFCGHFTSSLHRYPMVVMGYRTRFFEKLPSTELVRLFRRCLISSSVKRAAVSGVASGLFPDSLPLQLNHTLLKSNLHPNPSAAFSWVGPYSAQAVALGWNQTAQKVLPLPYTIPSPSIVPLCTKKNTIDPCLPRFLPFVGFSSHKKTFLLLQSTPHSSSS